MKAICLKTILLCMSLSLWGQDIKKLSPTTEKAMEASDFLHPNRGCLENSACSKSMGEYRLMWLEKINLVKKNSLSPRNNDDLQKLIKAFGWPMEFYFKNKIQNYEDIMVYSAACPKVQKLDFKRGIAFVKKLTRELTSANSNVEIVYRPVWVYLKDKIYYYSLPLNEMPLFLHGNELVFLTELEDTYYQVNVFEDGTLKIKSPDKTTLSFNNEREEIPCPDKLEVLPTPFQYSYCQKINDLTQKKEVIVRIFGDCI